MVIKDWFVAGLEHLPAVAGLVLRVGKTSTFNFAAEEIPCDEFRPLIQYHHRDLIKNALRADYSANCVRNTKDTQITLRFIRIGFASSCFRHSRSL